MNADLWWSGEYGTCRFCHTKPRGKNINLSSAGENTYVAPFGERSYALPMDMAGSPVEVNWKIINDLGGESQVFKANV
ncbi:TPA: hypothetical protein PXN29_001457 [Yersinia enterocolitica]|nr:hypothetical protein [Yersinia enterocolitica]HDL7349345.1 hypothetical protein [Yersinia enterocolitica]